MPHFVIEYIQDDTWENTSENMSPPLESWRGIMHLYMEETVLDRPTLYYVLMNSENIVKLQQLMTSKVIFIFSNILTSDMFRLEYNKWQHLTALVIKLLITTNIGFCYYKNVTGEIIPSRPSGHLIWWYQMTDVSTNASRDSNAHNHTNVQETETHLPTQGSLLPRS